MTELNTTELKDKLTGKEAEEEPLSELEETAIKKVEDVLKQDYRITIDKIEKFEFVRRKSDKGGDGFEPVMKMIYVDNFSKRRTRFIKINQQEGGLNNNTASALVEMSLLGYSIPNFEYYPNKFSDHDEDGELRHYDIMITDDVKEMKNAINSSEEETTNMTEEKAIDRLLLHQVQGLNDNKTANVMMFHKNNGKNKEIYFDPIFEDDRVFGNIYNWIKLAIDECLDRGDNLDGKKEPFKTLNDKNGNCFEAHIFRLLVEFLKECDTEKQYEKELNDIDNLTLDKILTIGNKLKVFLIFNNDWIFFNYPNNIHGKFYDFLLRKKYPDIKDKREREEKQFKKMIYFYNRNKEKYTDIKHKYYKYITGIEDDNVISSIYDGSNCFDNINDKIKKLNNKLSQTEKQFIGATSKTSELFNKFGEKKLESTYHPSIIGNNIETEYKNNERQFFNFKNINDSIDVTFENNVLKVKNLNRETRNTQEDYYISIVPNKFNEINMYNPKVHNLKFLKTDNDIENFNQQVLSKKLVIKEGEEREKTSRDNIQNTIANTIIFLANLYDLTFEETSRIILTAIDNNGYSHIRNNNDRVGRNFSASFQKTMKVLGILTGKSKSTVGLRLKRLPKSIVEILHDRKEEFTTKQQEEHKLYSQDDLNNLSNINMNFDSIDLLNYHIKKDSLIQR